MDNNLTLAVKELAYRLGADLVGIANIERFENAPIKMSPKGILPSAKSVVVCAVHHPDASIELDGEVRPQILGPYRIQYIMNDKLDVLSFKIGRMLDDLGYKTVPIASSNIWRYRGYKDMDATFAPDMSHIYAGVCAGLAKFLNVDVTIIRLIWALVSLFAGLIATLIFFESTRLVKDNPQRLALVESTQCGEVIFSLLGGILFLHDALPGLFGWLGLALIVGGMIINSLLTIKKQ